MKDSKLIRLLFKFWIKISALICALQIEPNFEICRTSKEPQEIRFEIVDIFAFKDLYPLEFAKSFEKWTVQLNFN